MKNEETAAGLFRLLVLGIAIAIPVSFYGAWVICKIIEWYHIPVTLNVIQIFGIASIINILTPQSESKDVSMLKSIGKIFSKFFVLSFVLLLMYAIHLFI